jgi:hypothetical protein
MLYGIAIQVARPSGDGVSVQQVIAVPAASIAWARSISTNNPRRTWREGSYATSASLLNHGGARRAMEGTQWDDRSSEYSWQLTTDMPVLFHIKDDEYLELKGGTMPRNVALRYQRAIEATGATLIGAHANSLSVVTGALENKITEGDSTLGKAPSGDGSIWARVEGTILAVDEKIRQDRTHMLDNYVPETARAKGAGHHRTHDNLPEGTVASHVAPEAVYAAPVAPAAAGDDPKPGDVLVRPNGTPHVCREVDGEIKNLSEVGLFRRVARRGVHVLLHGQPGTGKTAALEVAFPENGGLRTMILTPETEADDFYGSYVAVVGEDGRETLIWEDSELVRAMESGSKILLDEIGLAPANQLAPLFGLMDGRGELRIPTNPARGVIKAKEGFGIVAAYNPDSSRNISEALLSRFGLKMEITSDYEVARGLGVNPRMVDAAEHLEKQRVNGEVGWAPQTRELLRFREDEADLGIILAIRNLLNDAPEFEREAITGHLRERFGDLPGAARRIKPLGV